MYPFQKRWFPGLFQTTVGFGTNSWKTGKGPVFPLNARQLFQKLKFWNRPFWISFFEL
jgi:hypothetical protein